jgi:ubiquinone/menaquinone biosynthesis C-methylase UbiE
VKVEQRWKTRRLVPAAYDFVVGRERLARLGGRLLWGTDVRALYDLFAETGRLPAGSAVLDLPCGGGVAFRGVPRAAGLRYVAADLSAAMLGRARAEAARRALPIAFVRANAGRLPFPEGSFDRCVTFNGLHCFPDPAAAVAEMARVLRPGGTLLGSTVVSGAGARQDALLALFRRTGTFGHVGGVADVRAWLEAAGLEPAEVAHGGALAWFRAVKR